MYSTSRLRASFGPPFGQPSSVHIFSRTIIAKNTAIHTENCKLEIQRDPSLVLFCSPTSICTLHQYHFILKSLVANHQWCDENQVCIDHAHAFWGVFCISFFRINHNCLALGSYTQYNVYMHHELTLNNIKNIKKSFLFTNWLASQIQRNSYIE